MKKCINCGFENPDDITSCQSCSTKTFVCSSPEAIGGHIITPEEQHFWEHMTFRQFAILFIRLQALWFLPYAFDEATYLPTYFTRLHHTAFSVAADSDVRRSIFWIFFRIICHIAAMVVCMRYANRIASWLVRDSIPRQPPNDALEAMPTPPPDLTKP